MNQTNQIFITIFALISFGFLLKKFNYFSEKDGKVISKFLMHTTFPALLLVSAASVKLEPSLTILPLLSFFLSILMLTIAWFWLANYPNKLRGVLLMGAGGFNSGLFGFPIIDALFGKAGMIYIIIFDIGVTLICFGLLYPIGLYFSDNKNGVIKPQQIIKKIFSLPPFLATITGLLINILAIRIPTLCMDFFEILAKANKPIVLVLMGIYLSFEINKSTMLAISKVLLLRFTVGILAAIGLYYLLPELSLMKSVLMICVLLPIGMTILPFSDEMNYDSRVAGTLLNISLLLSFVLIWGMVFLLNLKH